MRIGLVAVLVLGVATGACAEKKAPIYLGLGMGALKLESFGGVGGFDTVGTVNLGYALVGVDLLPWLSAEARVHTSDDSDRFTSFDVAGTFPQQVLVHGNVSAGSFSSALLKVRVPTAGKVHVYGLVGGTDLRLESFVEQRNVQFGFTFVSSNRVNRFVLSAGGGVEVDVSKRWALRGEYLQIADSIETSQLGSASAAAYSFGATYRL